MRRGRDIHTQSVCLYVCRDNTKRQARRVGDVPWMNEPMGREHVWRGCRLCPRAARCSPHTCVSAVGALETEKKQMPRAHVYSCA